MDMVIQIKSHVLYINNVVFIDVSESLVSLLCDYN